MEIPNNVWKTCVAFLLVIVGILLWQAHNESQKSDEVTALLEASNKEVIFYRDAQGRSVAQIEQLKTLNVNDFLKTAYKDSLITELQKAVKESKSKINNGGSVTVAHSEGKIDKTTESVREKDPIDTTKTIIKSHFKDKWVEYFTDARLDSTKVVIKYSTHFLKTAYKDSLITELQKAVKESKSKINNGGSVTVAHSEGKIDKTTESVREKDPIDTTKTIIKSHFKDKWVEYFTDARLDSTKVVIKYSDSYIITSGLEKDKSLPFFKRLLSDPVPYTWVTTESPYSEVKSVKSYSKSYEVPSRWSIAIISGYGYNLVEVKPGVFIGIGTAYRLFDIGKKTVK
jgi:ElaB/YqjD/DUF883 family membrane-anchored ribosome-binding protein